jgi:signal peptidase II
MAGFLKSLSTHARLGLWAALVLHVGDRVTKWWMVHHVDEAQFPIHVMPSFNLVMTWNHGVSFGMFSGVDARIVLIAMTLAVTVGLCVWLWREQIAVNAFALGLMIGGATGNIVDRLHYGAVADFLDVYWQHYHWPAFNVADSGICVGVMLLIAHSIWGKEQDNALNNQQG